MTLKHHARRFFCNIQRNFWLHPQVEAIRMKIGEEMLMYSLNI